MNSSENVLAYSDLVKTRESCNKQDHRKLCKSFYDLASLYFEVARHTSLNFKWEPVTLSNAAFSCELFLKSLLYGFETKFNNIHELERLFKLLPTDVQDYIAQNIAIENRDTEFPLRLHEQNRAFEIYRYMSELKGIIGDPIFLLAFADILKFICNRLFIEDTKSEG